MAARKRWVTAIVGLMVFVGAFLTFFIAWAIADGINPQPAAALVFRVVSFPLFAVAPERLRNTYFWQLGTINSGLVAIVAAFLSWGWLNRASQHK